MPGPVRGLIDGLGPSSRSIRCFGALMIPSMPDYIPSTSSNRSIISSLWAAYSGPTSTCYRQLRTWGSSSGLLFSLPVRYGSVQPRFAACFGVTVTTARGVGRASPMTDPFDRRTNLSRKLLTVTYRFDRPDTGILLCVLSFVINLFLCKKNLLALHLNGKGSSYFITNILFQPQYVVC